MDTDSDSDVGFPDVNLSGVDFDVQEDVIEKGQEQTSGLHYSCDSELDLFALELELNTVANQWKVRTPSSSTQTNGETIEEQKQEHIPEGAQRLSTIATLISNGRYIEALKGDFAMSLFGGDPLDVVDEFSTWQGVRMQLLQKIRTLSECVEAELVGIAAFNLFLQLNYTGPTFDMKSKQAVEAAEVNPHKMFRKLLDVDNEANEQLSNTISAKRHTRYHNTVLSELACDGQWPFPVVEAPYMLLLARCIFSILANPTKGYWADKNDPSSNTTELFETLSSKLSVVCVWHARATVAHERLLLTQEPTNTLWEEVEATFPRCIKAMEGQSKPLQAIMSLEFGLACHHFERHKEAKTLFHKAKETSGLFLEVTGAQGVRTKFQTKATAQLVVRAVSAAKSDTPLQKENNVDADSKIKSQMIGFNEDDILHEQVQFQDEEENKVKHLTVLDQAILMGLCLEIKDNNPSDQLTAEEMSAFLSRVLLHHDDWIVYSTALLERAWLEFEGNHTKERAILQMQALADQHTDRLTITQSTRASIQDSSPVQDRLKNLHSIVYPPRWQMLRDVAERYAQLGIVTSAAEIFTEIESWDEVVECYRRAGKEAQAEKIVRERLSISETPRMWTALGDITNEPENYEKAIALSRGRFSQAYISLGKYHFDKGDLQKAADAYRHALKLRPLLPSVWFRVGTICMQLEDWEGALLAFSEVVQQQPEEAEAWANVAAVHMRNKEPQKAYPALTESLKHSRTNWRVWLSKLYTTLDLGKYDEAAQACHVLLDLSVSHSSQGVPELEEKCVKAIVGGVVQRYIKSRDGPDKSGLDAARRSLVRVQELLDRLVTLLRAPWVFETTAYLHEQVGQDTAVYDNLMKEYRSLTSIRAWEKDDHQVLRVVRTVSQIVHYQRGTKEELAKSKFLLSSVVKRIAQDRSHGRKIPEEVQNLETLLEEITAELQTRA